MQVQSTHQADVWMQRQHYLPSTAGRPLFVSWKQLGVDHLPRASCEDCQVGLNPIVPVDFATRSMRRRMKRRKLSTVSTERVI